MQSIIVIAHNIRSTHNIGSLFRTCEGFGVDQIILSGYSPYPALPDDLRLPHIARKTTEQIRKTALGAETMVPFARYEQPPLEMLRDTGYTILGLEQDIRAHNLRTYEPPAKIVLMLGEEVEGIHDDLRAQCDELVEIPMHGKKESFNVSVAAGIALYGLTVRS